MTEELNDGERDAVQSAAARRRFLKLAATAAPLVATLPSGAARAMGSSAQCVLDAIEASDDGVVPAVSTWLPPTSDTYVRLQGQQVSFSRDDQSTFPPSIETRTAFHIEALDGTDERFWLADGSEFFPTPSGEPAWNEDGRANVGLLKVFQPDSRTDPTTVGQCSPGPNDGPPTCLYPVSRIVPGGNIGIQASCLCSVNPHALPADYCVR